jgi:C-terminal processing protease CtpA/Prc
VGYLELYGFEPPDFARDALAAAMTFLAHTQALIIDVRHNRGGSPAMVALLCSYLLPAYPPIHLNDLYWRPDDSTRQWWTVPHLMAPRYEGRPVYILTSQETFSAAEEFAYNLQVLQRATVVGEHTPGAAHPGQGYRLDDHFWMFLPVGQAINPVTQQNWAETGVIPDVKVPAELSLLTAHLMGLNRLLETEPAGTHFRELQQSMLRVERELNARRADLISQLKQPTSGSAT